MSVNITKYIMDIPQIKQLIAAVVLVFLACSAYSVYDENTTDDATFDVFSEKASTDIKPMMDNALEYPTKENLRNANNELAVLEWRWLSQNEGQNKELFVEYLNECQLVIDGMQEGHTMNTEKMDLLYNELVPDN